MRTKENRIGCFLAGYSALLLRSGATCARVEKNVGRIAASWGIEFSMTILPRHVNLSLATAYDGTAVFAADIGASSVSYDKITRLSRLSWEIADNGLDIEIAENQFLSIDRISSANRWWVLIAVSFANAAFCRLFFGDMTAAAVVFVATMCGYYFKQLLMSRNVDIRIVFTVCAFVSSVLACADGLFVLGKTPDVAIATSVLYLVPGIPLLNSFSDMLDRHYISFFCRLTDAVVLTCCLSVGLCAGLWLMRFGMF